MPVGDTQILLRDDPQNQCGTGLQPVKDTDYEPVPQRGRRPQPKCGTGVPPVGSTGWKPVPQFSSRAAKILNTGSTGNTRCWNTLSVLATCDRVARPFQELEPNLLILRFRGN